MIELTETQREALHDRAGQPLSVTDPATHEMFVLVPRRLYDSLTDYDDGPWTDEEMDAEVTSHQRWIGDPACVLIDAATPEGQATGLHRSGVVSCLHLVTMNADRLVLYSCASRRYRSTSSRARRRRQGTLAKALL